MDPCPFVRILVGNLAVKFPAGSNSKHSLSSIHPSSSSSSSSCFCKIKLKNFPTQQATVPLLVEHSSNNPPALSSSSLNTLAGCMSLNKSQIEGILSSKKPEILKLEIYTGGGGGATCVGGSVGKLLGKVSVPLDLRKAESRPCVLLNGWVGIGGKKKSGTSSSAAEFYCCVKAEPDPRYVFRFGGEPECSPQVFQVQGSVKQAVFTCKFNLRNPGDRSLGSRSSISEPSTSRNWLPSSGFGADKDQSAKERKGWTITVHDLSGSPVAMASMVTPFVPSPGSDRVSQSNPGAWLILHPLQGTWRPWGRLEAWRERNNSLGYRFELLDDTIFSTPTRTTVVSSNINTTDGGKFTIDMTNSVTTPVCSPQSSCDFGSMSGWGSSSGSESGAGFMSKVPYKGFVMSSTVEGNNKCSKPEVEIGVQHVNCTEDAAAFVALAAAVDLSMDACRLFSHTLRKELRQQISQNFVV